MIKKLVTSDFFCTVTDSVTISHFENDATGTSSSSVTHTRSIYSSEIYHIAKHVDLLL